MNIIQSKKDGSADIKFSFRERFIVLCYGRIHFSAEAFKNFTNIFAHALGKFNINFRPDLRNKPTKVDDFYKEK
jgi:hypothetical protein|tara:strand:- start:2340 stop:2561 length:222 start_codon:yes stop_codon:yes gene_type:complete